MYSFNRHFFKLTTLIIVLYLSYQQKPYFIVLLHILKSSNRVTSSFCQWISIKYSSCLSMFYKKLQRFHCINYLQISLLDIIYVLSYTLYIVLILLQSMIRARTTHLMALVPKSKPYFISQQFLFSTYSTPVYLYNKAISDRFHWTHSMRGNVGYKNITLKAKLKINLQYNIQKKYSEMLKMFHSSRNKRT